MAKETEQMRQWMGTFGEEYTQRNAFTFEEFEEFSKKRFGLTRTEMNGRFLKDISRSIKILEVGANIGNQLQCLQKMGFQNLYGIELQAPAVEISKQRTSGINLIQGSAFDIPFKDKYFDLVFTSGVLIHLSPKDIRQAMLEIYRCAQTYIWGFEYWAPQYTEINYRGHEGLLWKTDYAKLYLEYFPDLKLVQEEKFKYTDEENVDSMFLLKKGS